MMHHFDWARAKPGCLAFFQHLDESPGNHIECREHHISLAGASDNLNTGLYWRFLTKYQVNEVWIRTELPVEELGTLLAGYAIIIHSELTRMARQSQKL